MAKKAGKLNVIWFHDEQTAKRLRLWPGWIRAVTYFVLLSFLFAAGGAFAAYQFWKRSQESMNERREVETRLHEALLKLERLQNIEKLLKTSDPTELSQLLAGLGLEYQAPQASKDKSGNGKESKDQKDAKPAKDVKDKAPAVDLTDIMGRTDLGQVSVENFRAKADAKGVSYGFDLSNLQPQALSGNGQLYAVFKDGSMTLLQTGKDDLGFSIQRFKQVSAQAQLPKGADPGSIFGFRLVLANASGKTIFSDTYPVAQAQ